MILSARNLLDGNFSDISEIGGVCWLFHDPAHGHIETISILGNAHVAILNEGANEVRLVIHSLLGDKSGILHLGGNQTVRFYSDGGFVPQINFMAYK